MKKHLAMLLVVGFVAMTITAVRPAFAAFGSRTGIGAPDAVHRVQPVTVGMTQQQAITDTGQRMLITQPTIVAKATMATTPVAIANHVGNAMVISSADASRASPKANSAIDVYYKTSPMTIARGTPEQTITIADDVAIITPEVVARSGQIVVFASFGGVAFART